MAQSALETAKRKRARAVERVGRADAELRTSRRGKKAAVGRAFQVARETGSTVPAVMSEVMRQWQKTGNPPHWLTEDVESEETL